MQTKKWKIITVEGVKGFEDIAACLLINEGSPGVEIEEKDERVTMKGYFPSESMTSEKVLAVKKSLADMKEYKLKITVSTLAEKDWGESWKKYFKPLRIGEHIIVKPPWEEVKVKDKKDIIIDINPAMAFGTGTHPTTKMVIEALEELILSSENVDLLDVGCGTGILSIAALKLGAEKALAIDTDLIAVKEAKKTILRNGINEGIEVRHGEIKTIDGTFSIIVANIIAEVLTDLSAQLLAKMKRGGYLVLSGILKERSSALYDKFTSLGLVECQTYQEEGWVTYVFRYL